MTTDKVIKDTEKNITLKFNDEVGKIIRVIVTLEFENGDVLKPYDKYFEIVESISKL